MSSIRTIFSYIIFLAFLGPSLSVDVPSPNENSGDSQADIDTFQKLLNQADPPALHSALHDYSPKKFGHGMFPEDRTAVEAIHREEPDVATGILKIANVAKRQISNGTLPTTTSAGESSEPTTRVTPVPLGGESSTAASETASTPTSESAASSETASITSAADTTSSSSPSLTAGEVITTTNGVGLTVISTVGGGATTISPSRSSSNAQTRSSLTSTLVHTSTLPNGQQSTITAVTVIGGGGGGGGAQTPSGTAGAGSTSTATGQPGLQTGEAAMTRGCGREMAVVLGAAVGVAFML